MYHRTTSAERHAARWPRPWSRGWRLAVGLLLGVAVGCGTTRVTNSQRTATEQLLVSSAIDQAIGQLDFRVLAGKAVYFDPQYLAAGPDQGYVVSSLRQHLLACGCLLHEDRARATYVVEARSGGVGTDQHQLLFGVPQMNVPSVLPGQPSLIPEIPLAKKTDQKGIAKLAVFAYNRRTGRPLWQSGVVQAASTSKDTWVFGAGPFRQGTLGEATEFAGLQINIPLLSGKDGGQEAAAPVLAVTRPAVWEEAPAPPLVADAWPGSMATTAGAAKLGPPAAPGAPSVETVSPSPAQQKAGAPASKAGGEPAATLSMEPIRIPWYRPAPATSGGAAPGQGAAPHRPTGSPGAGSEPK